MNVGEFGGENKKVLYIFLMLGVLAKAKWGKEKSEGLVRVGLEKFLSSFLISLLNKL